MVGTCQLSAWDHINTCIAKFPINDLHERENDLIVVLHLTSLTFSCVFLSIWHKGCKSTGAKAYLGFRLKDTDTSLLSGYAHYSYRTETLFAWVKVVDLLAC